MLNGSNSDDICNALCFLLTSVAYTIGWTAISSMLASFKRDFGPAVLLQLNMAYFLPSIPILYIQMQYDAVLNRIFGLPQATGARMIIGLGGAALISGLFPFVSPSLNLVLLLTCLMGLCCGLAFGSSYQLVSHFSVRCNVALTIGFVGSGPIVLLLEALDKVGPHPTQSQQILLYTFVVPFFTFLGLVAVLLLLQWHWRELYKAGREEELGPSSSMEQGAFLLEDASRSAPSLSRSSTDSESTAMSTDQSQHMLLRPSGSALQRHGRPRPDQSPESAPLAKEVAARLPHLETSWQLLEDIWPAALALGVSVGCATLFFPFFTYCPSSGWLNALLPQALFFTRTISDIAGRVIPPNALWLHTARGLHVMTAVKLVLMPLGFWYIVAAPRRSDALALGYICVFWLQSGAVNSASFVMANKWARQDLKERAGGALALVFQASCLVALALAFLIQKYCAPFSSTWER